MLFLPFADVKKITQHKSCGLSFIQGLAEDYSPETAIGGTEELLQRGKGRSRFVYDFWFWNTCSQAYILIKDDC